MNKKNGKTLIVFLKCPENGNVKTRLAKTAGRELAAKFYRFCCENTFAECRKLERKKIKTILYVNDKKDLHKIIEWTKDKFSVSIQKGNDLGERMRNSFNEVFKLGNYKAVIIGTDVPDISAEIIEQAFDHLDNYDCVVGPASDGGYYLLGLKKLEKDLFSGIDWSSSSVFGKTINKIDKYNLSKKILTQLSDIDTEKDLNLWLEKHPDSEIGDRIKNILRDNIRKTLFI